MLQLLILLGRALALGLRGIESWPWRTWRSGSS